MSKNWAYRNYLKWKNKHPTCNGKQQSPINIDTSIVSDCRQTCQLEVDYRPSKCHIVNNNRTPIIKFDPNSYIIFRNEKMILHSMTMHTPSMHTINGEFYDLEVQIYHTRTPKNFSDGGVAFSLFFKRGKDTISNKSKANYFFNQFINEIPSEETEFEKEVSVGEDWNPNYLFPKTKSFFYYQGSLPRPPCKENWTWVIFEEVGTISKTNYEAFNLVFENNRRPIRPRNDREIFYNNSISFINSKAKKKAKVQRAIAELKEMENKLEEDIKNKKDTPSQNDDTMRDEEEKLRVEEIQSSKTTTWYLENKDFIRNTIITLILVLMVYIGIKLVSYLIRGGILNDFMKNQLESKKISEKKAKNSENNTGNQQSNENNGNSNNTNNNNSNNAENAENAENAKRKQKAFKL